MYLGHDIGRYSFVDAKTPFHRPSPFMSHALEKGRLMHRFSVLHCAKQVITYNLYVKPPAES